MKISQDVRLTINILSVMQERPLKLKEVAELTGTTYHYVHKIVKRLRKNNWVGSKCGPNGGIYAIPVMLNLRHVIELWEGLHIITENSPASEIAYERLLEMCEQIPIRSFGG